MRTQGPTCAYWHEEEAPFCGHGSCYAIVSDEDGNADYELLWDLNRRL